MSGDLAVQELAAASAEPVYRIHEAPLPAFVEHELVRLYKNVFASLAHVRSLGLADQVRACVCRQAGQVTAVVLFWQHGGTVEVLSGALALRPPDVARFARAVFTTYRSAAVITFPAVRSAIVRLPFPFQRFNCLEDIVLDLPPSAEAYFASLGKNMRASLKRYQKRIATDFPDFRYTFHATDDISEQDVSAIVALSSARIASKNQASTHTGEKTRQLFRLVKECGVVLVARIDGRVCAGVICSEVGGNFFMHVVAHDPVYDDYRVGKVCCYLSICDAIARGAREYHFLWGRYEYKYRLLGQQRDFDRLVIYRSRLALLLNLGLFVNIAWRGYGRRAKWWLFDERRGDARWVQLARGMLRRLGVKG
ncbi:GNAT family N-acetyltransferase [Massilia horti]|uniref:GNAT family N-acetyltransferase n=1 Tax=Massilia horti TaxID=2562153 RepID=A0A4Y9T3C1_9BURK|nr:GNAT family N-acetyltransferase [Massilia horti]TFW34374.1 GNAT family N-acetyltransferase [Massilia horti]